MLVKVNTSDYDGGAQMVAQDVINKQLILELNVAPSYTHTVVEDIPSNFMQMVHPGRFGEYMNLATIQDVQEAIDYLPPEKVEHCGDLYSLLNTYDVQLMYDAMLVEGV